MATAIDWAGQSVSVAQRDARLKTLCRLARYLRAEDKRPDRHFSDLIPAVSPCRIAQPIPCISMWSFPGLYLDPIFRGYAAFRSNIG